MRILRAAPADSEFVPLDEYRSSTPASFALDDMPVLYYKVSGTVGGYISGQCEIWISGDGIYIWLPEQLNGIYLPYFDVVCNALKNSPPVLFIMFSGLEGGQEPELYITVPDPGKLYRTIKTCMDEVPYRSEDDEIGYYVYGDSGSESQLEENVSEGDPRDDFVVNLQKGEADDEQFEQPPLDDTEAAARVRVHRGVLGKSKAPHYDDETPPPKMSLPKLK